MAQRNSQFSFSLFKYQLKLLLSQTIKFGQNMKIKVADVSSIFHHELMFWSIFYRFIVSAKPWRQISIFKLRSATMSEFFKAKRKDRRVTYVALVSYWLICTLAILICCKNRQCKSLQ